MLLEAPDIGWTVVESFRTKLTAVCKLVISNTELVNYTTTVWLPVPTACIADVVVPNFLTEPAAVVENNWIVYNKPSIEVELDTKYVWTNNESN